MSTVFVLLLLAAIVGIIKPYVAGMKRKHFAILAVIFFVAVGVSAPKTNTSDDKKASGTTEAKADASDTNDNTSDAKTDVPAEAASKWSYSEDKDEMRGTVAKYASVNSENEIDLSFPYGEVRGTIIVRKRPQDGLNVMFQVEKGQILCHSFGSNDTISVKFDDGPVKKYGCTGTSDGSSNTAFLKNEAGFLANLKKAKKTIVEAEFYQQGNQQFVFETANLKW